MSNKPMLSVERELLERAVSAIEKHHGSLQWVIASDLRALLDKEVDMDSDASKHQGEPVAYQIRRRTDREDSAWTKWKECSEMERAMHSHEVRKYNRFGIMREIRALYAEQPAPVSMVMPELKTPYYKVVPTKFGNKEGFWQITPDSSIVYDNRDEAQARADARNASRAQHFFDSLKPCLEEVARLNGVNL